MYAPVHDQTKNDPCALNQDCLMFNCTDKRVVMEDRKRKKEAKLDEVNDE
jgi:hypothetical protein